MMPESPADESLHAVRVLDFVRERIGAAGGWLPFDVYMQLALYEPGLGYYSAGAHKLGAGGDFTTAPEISPLFGRCLARHCAQVLGALGGGDVLELGAGTGRLAFDVLTTLDALGCVPVRYRILEVSADLRQRQQQLLGTLPPMLAARVEWLDAAPREPWQGALLANEVLDALPVSVFTWRDGVPLERGVSLDERGALVWREQAASPELCAEVERVRSDLGAQWPSDYTSELCPRVAPWIGEVTRAMTRGVALLIDYGAARREYYHAQREVGTLRCHYRHRALDDPFLHPGLADLTAWVDFTRVAEAADAAQLDVLGYATQMAALLGLGIEADVASHDDATLRARRASEARQLLMPNEMGENFKCMALGRGFDAPLDAFAHQDLRSRL
jgi:SAM-dependent MidA family methyltransferase